MIQREARTLCGGLLITLVVGTACGGPLYSVSTSSTSGGIPFYPHETVDQLSSTYLEEWYRLHLKTTWKAGSKASKAASAKAKKNSKDPGQKETVYVTTSVRFALSQECANALLGEFSKASKPEEAYKNIADVMQKTTPVPPGPVEQICNQQLLLASPTIRGLETITPSTAASGLRLIASNRKRVSRVGTELHYLNVKKAAAGTTSAIFKVNPNGTLGEVEASVDDQTLSTVLSVLPVDEFARSVLGLDKDEEDAESAKRGKPIVVNVEFTVTPVKRLYHLTSEEGSLPVTGTSAGVMLRVLESRQSEMKEQRDQPNVKFEGSIQLPKLDE